MLHVARTDSSVPDRLSEVGFAVTRSTVDELANISAATFDAIVFTNTASSIASLETAITHAARLLASTGRLVVEDCDLAAPDTLSLRWFYDVQELLTVAGIHEAERVHAPNPDPSARWRDGVRATGVIRNGTQMRVAISAHFMIRELQRFEGLYRFIADGLPADPRGAATAAHLRTVERRLIANDSLMPVGLRIVADRAR